MNHVAIHKVCAWGGAICTGLILIGFFAIAGFVPPPSPADSAEEIASFYRDNADAIRIGLILTMFGAAFLMPWSAEMALQMRRIEGRSPVLGVIEFGVGALFVIEFIYLIFFWQVATFRADRSAEIVQMINDLGWIPFVGITATGMMQAATIGTAMLLDKRPVPIFPRWLGFYNLWCAVLFLPGTFNVFFKTGPLAWNGIIAWWLPVFFFVIWLVVNSVYLSKAIDHQLAEEARRPLDDVAALRHEVARLAQLVETREAASSAR